jgi:hypothetical protein
LYATDFHFELGGQQIVAIEDDKVRDLFVRHRTEQVNKICVTPPADLTDLCAQLRNNGDKVVGFTDWFVAEYALSKNESAELRSLLVAAKMGTLKPQYTNTKGEDGTTRTYRLVSGTLDQNVSCYMIGGPSEPSELLPVHMFIAKLFETHQGERTNAKAATPQKRRELERAAWKH